MAKALPLPDGTTVAIREGETPAQTWERAQRMYPEAFGLEEEAPVKKGGSGLGDLARAFGSGAVGATGALASVFGADNAASRSLSEAGKSLQEGLSDKRKAELQMQAERMKKAEESGSTWQEVKAGLLNVLEAPLQTTASALGSFVPVLATLPLAKIGLGARAITALRGAISGAQGAGSVKQSTYEAVLRAEIEEGKSPEQAQAAAVRAQNYVGENLDQILLGAGLGYVAGTRGVEKLLPGGVRPQAGAVQQALAKRIGERAATGVTAAAAEMPLEGTQGAQERVAANLALQRTGRDVDTFTGAAGQFTQEALAGGLGGGALGAALPDRSLSLAAAQERKDKQAAAKEAAEQERIAAEKEAAEKQTPEYALKIANQLKTLEQEKLDLQKQVRSVSKDSLTEAEDKAHNKEIQAQLKKNAAERDALAPEKNRLIQSGLYQQALEQERVAGMSPMDYMLERTGEVRDRKTTAPAADTAYEESGLAFQDPLVPGVERRKAEEAERTRVAAVPATYAAERMELARTQMYEPSGQDFVEYLLQDPYKAGLLIETRTPLPGLSSSESSLILKEVAKRLKAMGKEELAARQAELQAQTVGKPAADPMAAFMEQSEALDVDRRQGVTDADVAFAEKQAVMPTTTTTQGELFGGAGQRVNMPQAGTPADINAQIAELERQLDVAKSYGAPDSATRPGDRGGLRANRERVSSLLEQIKDLKDRQAKIAAGAPMGGDTDAVRAYIAAGTPDRAPNQTIEEWYASLPENAGTVSALPKQEKAQRDAAAARTAAAQDVILDRKQDRREAVIGNLLKEIQLVRGRLKPETITQITRDVDAILNKPEDSDAALRALDDLSARWRAGTQRGTFGATAPTPTQTSEDMLRTQMDRAFAQRERYDTETLSILDQIAENFKAFNANPERRNMAGEWLNRVTQTGRPSPEMTRDVQNELAQLERGKRSETETPMRQTAFGLATKPTQRAVQGELDADLMPQAVAPQAETRIVNGKVQYVSPEDKGPLQGSAAERYAPMQKGVIFDTPEELDRYLASDYLKEARENQGLARETVSRLSKQVTEYEAKIADTQKKIDALQERKAELQTLQVSERRVANQLVADLELQLGQGLELLAEDLGPIRMALQQAEINLAAAEARSEETSRLIANNMANFTAMDDKVVRAAEATAEAKAELRKARNKLGSLDEKRPAIEKAQRKVIDALQRQRNPLLYEMQEQMQDLQKKQSLARVTQPRTVARLQKEIDALEDLMDMQRNNPYVPSSAMITFLNNDLQLQMDAMQDRQKIGAAKRSIIYFNKELTKAASYIKADISTHPEVKALREQIGIAKELGTDALRGVEGEMALLDAEVEKLQIAQSAQRRQADNIEDQIIRAGEERTFAGQLAAGALDTRSAIDRAETLAKDKKALEEFQGRTERLNALPGQRIDFSKRQEMFQMVNAATEDFADLDTAIENMRLGIDELQVRDYFMNEEMLDMQDQAKSFRGPRKNSKAGKEHFAKMEEHKKKMEENNKRIKSLRDSITQYEKTRATKQVALAKAERAMSSDPEIYQEITKSIDARMDKLDKTIAGKQAAVVKADAAILEMARDIKAKADEGKTAPEKLAKMRERLSVLKASQADRNKHLKEYLKERDVLKARRSNRLGIKRTLANIDALKEERDTAQARLRTQRSIVNSKDATKAEKAAAAKEVETLTESIADLNKRIEGRPKKAAITEQEQFDAELDRVQELASAKDRLAQMENGMAALQKAKEPKTEAKKTERAERIAKLQDDINKQQAEVDRLTPKAVGAVSQATKIESSAPGKLRAGTAESKADKGVSRRPITESRAVAQPTAEKAVADANAFAARLAAAKTPATLDAEFAAKETDTQNKIIEAVEDNIARLQIAADNLSNELLDLNSISATSMTPQSATRKEKVRDDLGYAERMLDGALRDRARLLKVQEEAEVAAPADQEEVGLPSGYTSFTGKDSIGEVEFDPDARYRVSKTNGQSMSVAQVQKAYDALTSKWVNKPTTVVVADETGLPARIRSQAERDKMTGKIPGLYDPKSKKVYLVASNLRSVNDVILTTVHEIAGHFGLQSILGDTYAKTMTDIYNGNAAIRKAANAKMKQIKSLDQNTAVEEALAEQAELDPNAPDTRSAMRRIYDTIKKWIRDTLGFKDTVTDAQVNQIIANARHYVIEGGTAGTGTAGVAVPSYRSKAATAPVDALEVLSKKIIAQPKTLREKAGSNLALQAEMQAVDMRAGLRETLKFGDDSLFTQAMYHVRKAEQKMAQMFTVMNSGPLVAYKDEKGLVGYRSSNQNSAREVFDAIADVPIDDPQLKTDLTQAYLVAVRANNKGLPKLDLGAMKLEQAELDAALAAADANPALKSALENVRRKYSAYNKGMIEFLASTGRISKKTAADLLKEGDYVPFYRVDKNGKADLVFNNNVTFNVGDIRRQPYLAELKGGETKLLPLNEAIQRNTLLLTDMALTNNAAKSVAYGLQALGKGKGPVDPITGKPTDRMAIKKGFGPDDASVVRFYQEPDPNKPDDDGKRHIVVDTTGTLAEGIPAELVVQSLEGSSVALPGFLKLGGVAADLLRAGVTRTPLYIARKLVREPMAASFTGGLNTNAFSSVFKAGAEFLRMSTGDSDAQAKLIEKGLIQSNIFAGDMSDMKKMALQLASGKDQNVLDKVFAAADRYAMRADAATLALVLKNAEANGLSEVEADMMTMESMNFYKRGLSPTLQYAARLIPFFNAQIQGLNVLAKAARGNMPFEEQQQIKRKFFNNALLLTFTGLVYALAMEDDEYFRNARPRDKYSNFFMPIPGVDEPLKLPIPFEAGYFFSLAVAAVDSMRAETDGKAQWQAVRDLFLGSIPGYSSMGMPQIVKPAFEVWSNKNFLTGGNVESLRFQGLDPEARYLATTTELAKQMSKALPILSPIQIEHLVRGYLGVLPLVAAAGANSLFEREDKGAKPEGRASDLPLIGSAFQKKYGGADADVVFREVDEIMQTRNTFNDILKSGRREEAIEYRDKHRVEMALASAAGQYRQVIGRINADVRRTQERNDLTPEEKRLRLDALDKAKQDRAEAFRKMQRTIEAREAGGKT
jgi:hypothetical protein